MDGADLDDQLSLGMLGRSPSLLALGGPGVEGRGRDPSRGAGGRYREAGGLLGIDTAVAHHGVDCSLTQKATVRLSSSWPCRPPTADENGAGRLADVASAWCPRARV